MILSVLNSPFVTDLNKFNCVMKREMYFIPIYFILFWYSECLTKETLDGLGEFNIGGQIIQTVKYADDLVLIAKEETVLQSMIDKLIETGRCNGMEMNVEKTKVMRISRQPSPVTIMIGQKQLEDVECFKYLCSVLINDGRCTCEIQSRIAVAEAAFNKKKALFTSKLDLNLKKKVVKCYIWSVAFFVVVKLVRFGQQIRNTWKVLKCGAGEGWRRSVGLSCEKLRSVT